MNESPWLRLDADLVREPPLEIRAEPDGRGGWRIRSEHTCGGEGRLFFGFLSAEQPYAVRVDSAV